MQDFGDGSHSGGSLVREDDEFYSDGMRANRFFDYSRMVFSGLLGLSLPVDKPLITVGSAVAWVGLTLAQAAIDRRAEEKSLKDYFSTTIARDALVSASVWVGGYLTEMKGSFDVSFLPSIALPTFPAVFTHHLSRDDLEEVVKSGF